MKVYAHKNHNGNVEVNAIQTNQPGEISLEVAETQKPLSSGSAKSFPKRGDVVAVNGVMYNCEVVA